MTVNDAVAKRIYKLLEKYDMTKYRLEQKSGIYHGAMNRILSGQNKTVTLTTLYKLANGFDITIFEFLDDDLFRSKDIELD
ncbi:XRE family transcriptional regulator [Candidatus Borkfalkia ceftriaxoniphila]|uniref:XRE family transcriptional regulator n=1 Tax=Candidatus Borkfalkia ceftriaxoniphila TaxID=2508949 RepID=A0A4Q2KFP3_9FIRM|nr:helix-turn-helix transcriptional regulator [Candidatus Borkfalkia ceftriaxoniphila]RXZ63815.1 XRE family transcriptional regulator [Candidatus Borkfalkia ceftriaxoniphila]